MANPQEQNREMQLEYVTITVLRGQVEKIEPKRADTESAIEAAKTDGIAGALNKLAEYGFRLLQARPFCQCKRTGRTKASYLCTVSVEPVKRV